MKKLLSLGLLGLFLGSLSTGSYAMTQNEAMKLLNSRLERLHNIVLKAEERNPQIASTAHELYSTLTQLKHQVGSLSDDEITAAVTDHQSDIKALDTTIIQLEQEVLIK